MGKVVMQFLLVGLLWFQAVACNLLLESGVQTFIGGLLACCVELGAGS